MKTPERLEPLVEDGLIDEVVAQLKSGKEATVYLVRSNDTLRCAKVYKEANQRSFKQAATYREGRKVKNSRVARAMEKGSRFGRQEMEEAWQNAEVSALYRLADAGVRVPAPHGCFDGVLLMDMVADANGNPAPRLSEVSYTPEEARSTHLLLIREVVKMLCAGLVHGDLSEFNILVDPQGPVIIDLPQAVDAAGNNHAQSMLERDVGNLANYFSQFAPELAQTRYAAEIWNHYESGTLTPEVELTGQVEEDTTPADLDSVLREVMDAQEEEARQRAREAEKMEEDGIKPKPRTTRRFTVEPARPAPVKKVFDYSGTQNEGYTGNRPANRPANHFDNREERQPRHHASHRGSGYSGNNGNNPSEGRSGNYSGNYSGNQSGNNSGHYTDRQPRNNYNNNSNNRGGFSRNRQDGFTAQSFNDSSISPSERTAALTSGNAAGNSNSYSQRRPQWNNHGQQGNNNLQHSGNRDDNFGNSVNYTPRSNTGNRFNNRPARPHRNNGHYGNTGGNGNSNENNRSFRPRNNAPDSEE